MTHPVIPVNPLKSGIDVKNSRQEAKNTNSSMSVKEWQFW